MNSGGDGKMVVGIQIDQFEKLALAPFKTREKAEEFVKFLNMQLNVGNYGMFPFDNQKGYMEFEITESSEDEFYIWYKISQKNHAL